MLRRSEVVALRRQFEGKLPEDVLRANADTEEALSGSVGSSFGSEDGERSITQIPAKPHEVNHDGETHHGT